MNEALIFAITRPKVWIPAVIGVVMLVGGILSMKWVGTAANAPLWLRSGLWVIPPLLLLGYAALQSGRAEVAYIWGWSDGRADALAQVLESD